MTSINTSSTDPLYLAYRSVGGPSADLILPAVALNLVALVGIVLNGTVIVVTVRSNSLRGSANFLMALICFCELVHQIGHTFFLVVVVSGTNFVSLLTADLFMAPMLFASNCGLMAMFCAAFDRLFAVISPHKHFVIFTKYKFPYLLGHLLICTIYGAFTLNYVLSNAFENAGNPTTGVVAETLLSHPVGNKMLSGTFIISLGSTCCYVSIFVIIRCKNVVTEQTNTRVLRSLVIILSINIGGYLFTMVMYQLLYAFGSILGPPIRTWQVGFIAGILLNVASGSNVVVLYFNSTDYRRVFKKEFQALKGYFCNKNAVHPISVKNQVRCANQNNKMNIIQLSQQINVKTINLNR